MAMDALKNLSNNVPGWLKQLDELSGQIDLRQAELIAVAAAKGKDPETKSLRNKGSTESLRPKDDVPMTSAHEATLDGTMPEDGPGVAMRPSTPPTEAEREHVAASPPSPSAVNQRLEEIKAARARARQAKRRQRSSSMASAEGAPAGYRKQAGANVHYDSYVQDFFDDLERFVSSSRNLLHKAKTAVKIAQIKRQAKTNKLESNENGDDEPSSQPQLMYLSTRRDYGPAGANGQPPDVYGRLDKSLGIVQSMCKHGSHQVLRDGDCNDEISEIQKQLTEVFEVSTKEAKRIQQEEPELAKETGELGKIRTRRPIKMRCRISPGPEDGSPLKLDGGDPEKLEVANIDDQTPHPLDAPLEGDPNITKAYEGISVAMQLLKLQYRSIRAMRSRGP